MAAGTFLSRIRLALWGLVAIAVFAAGALLLGHLQEAARQGASLPGAARLGGDFELVDHNGNAFSLVCSRPRQSVTRCLSLKTIGSRSSPVRT